MGETFYHVGNLVFKVPFSILKRIVMGETSLRSPAPGLLSTFSILKRIVMGET